MISRSVTLACPPDYAFEVFTTQASTWWPASRRHTGDAASEIVISAEGPFFEIAPDGRRAELGFVRAWEPPRRIVLDFYPGTDPEHPTEAVITFVPVPGGTLVRVDHGPTAASLDLFDQRAPRYEESWEVVFAALADAIEPRV